jgi:hypothetical protein
MVGDSCQLCDYVEHCALDIPVAIKALDNQEDPSRWL